MSDKPRFFDGYGRCWSEPLAIGRWARLKQRMREPATKPDYLIGLLVMWLVLLAIIALVPVWFDQ